MLSVQLQRGLISSSWRCALLFCMHTNILPIRLLHMMTINILLITMHHIMPQLGTNSVSGHLPGLHHQTGIFSSKAYSRLLFVQLDT